MSILNTARTLTMTSDREWQRLLDWLPADLETTGWQTGAYFVSEHVPSASALLRLAFAYVVSPSLRTVSAWARLTGVATLSHVALDHRLRRMDNWLAHLLGQQLARGTTVRPVRRVRRLLVLDASTAQRLGSAGTDWRLHVALDLATLRITDLFVTGPDVGETFGHWSIAPGDLLLGDMTYGTRDGVAHVVDQRGDVLVRITWQNFPLQDPATGQPVDLLAHARTLAPGTVGAWEVTTAPTRTSPSLPGRLVIVALPDEQAARARQRKAKTARRPETVEAAGYVFLFTTLTAEELTAEEVAALYRARWQIECAFKRLKRLFPLADIRAHTDALCLTTVLATLLLALFLEDLAARCAAFSPSVAGHLDLQPPAIGGPARGSDPPGDLGPTPHQRLGGAAAQPSAPAVCRPTAPAPPTTCRTPLLIKLQGVT
ncbi:MAG: transposase [Armatimonadota bacterium]